MYSALDRHENQESLGLPVRVPNAVELLLQTVRRGNYNLCRSVIVENREVILQKINANYLFQNATRLIVSGREHLAENCIEKGLVIQDLCNRRASEIAVYFQKLEDPRGQAAGRLHQLYKNQWAQCKASARSLEKGKSKEPENASRAETSSTRIAPVSYQYYTPPADRIERYQDRGTDRHRVDEDKEQQPGLRDMQTLRLNQDRYLDGGKRLKDVAVTKDVSQTHQRARGDSRAIATPINRHGSTALPTIDATRGSDPLGRSNARGPLSDGSSSPDPDRGTHGFSSPTSSPLSMSESKRHDMISTVHGTLSSKPKEIGHTVKKSDDIDAASNFSISQLSHLSIRADALEDEDPVDPLYHRRKPPDASKLLGPGRVISVIEYLQYTGDAKNFEDTPEEWLIEGRRGWIRSRNSMFVIVRRHHGRSVAIPVSTYGGRGVAKRGLSNNDVHGHAMIHSTSSPPRQLRGEPILSKTPIQVYCEHGEKLDPASRVNFKKVSTIEHNVRFKVVGRVAPSSFETFIEYWTEWLQTLLPNQRSAQPTQQRHPPPGQKPHRHR